MGNCFTSIPFEFSELQLLKLQEFEQKYSRCEMPHISLDLGRCTLTGDTKIVDEMYPVLKDAFEAIGMKFIDQAYCVGPGDKPQQIVTRGPYACHSFQWKHSDAARAWEEAKLLRVCIFDLFEKAGWRFLCPDKDNQYVFSQIQKA